MKKTDELLDTLDDTMAVPNRIASSVEEIHRYYDPDTAEHVFTLTYRVKIAPTGKSASGSRLTPLIDSIIDRRLLT